VAHRDRIRNGDRAELERVRTAGMYAFFNLAGEGSQRHVARRDFIPARADTHLRLAKVVVGQACGSQHRTGGRPVWAVGDLVAARLHLVDHD
jgi:hypothetical protein